VLLNVRIAHTKCRGPCDQYLDTRCHHSTFPVGYVWASHGRSDTCSHDQLYLLTLVALAVGCLRTSYWLAAQAAPKPTKKLTKGGVQRRALGIVACYNEPFPHSRRIARNGKRVFVYYNVGCAYANRCDVSVEGLDMLPLVDLLLVGDDPH
jgi:hypothetical protein